MFLMMYNLYSVYITLIVNRFGLKASAKCLNCKLCTHGEEDLRGALRDLDVLVVQQAAHDGEVGLVLCRVGADSRRALVDVAPHAAWPVLPPPGVVRRDVEREQVTVLGLGQEI